MSHALIALAVQMLLGLALGDWWIGAAAGAALFVGREYAQAEYRWIEAFGGGKRANMPWWGGFDPRAWTKLDAWIDWIAPLAAVTVVAGVAGQ